MGKRRLCKSPKIEEFGKIVKFKKIVHLIKRNLNITRKSEDLKPKKKYFHLNHFILKKLCYLTRILASADA